MKLLKYCAMVLALAGGAVFANPAPATATEYLCVAGAYRINGSFVRGTRAEVTRFERDRACRRALRRCNRRLDRVRYTSGRIMPFARCEIIDVLSIGGRADDYYDGDRYDYDDGPRYGGYCNYQACAARYRTFRESDCSFIPRAHAPRTRCEL